MLRRVVIATAQFVVVLDYRNDNLKSSHPQVGEVPPAGKEIKNA
jgi:hypothetical protein